MLGVESRSAVYMVSICLTLCLTSLASIFFTLFWMKEQDTCLVEFLVVYFAKLYSQEATEQALLSSVLSVREISSIEGSENFSSGPRYGLISFYVWRVGGQTTDRDYRVLQARSTYRLSAHHRSALPLPRG